MHIVTTLIGLQAHKSVPIYKPTHYTVEVVDSSHLECLNRMSRDAVLNISFPYHLRLVALASQSHLSLETLTSRYYLGLGILCLIYNSVSDFICIFSISLNQKSNSVCIFIRLFVFDNLHILL